MTEKRGYTHAQAIAYLGVKRKFFDTNIKPRCSPTRCGTVTVYERAELDRAFDEYKAVQQERDDKKPRETRQSDLAADFHAVAARIMAKRKAALKAQ